MLPIPRLQKLHVHSLVACHWIVFLKTRPFAKRNNTKFANVSSFTSLLMCSTHFTLSCRILLFSLTTTTNFFKFVYSEITGQSAWRVLFRPPWCCLLLWQLKVIRIWLTSILDVWFPGPSYLVQEVLVLYFLFVFSVLYTKMHWREHSLADTVHFSTILQFSSEMSQDWGNGLPCLCPLRIYCAGQQHKAFLISNFRCVLNVVCFLLGNSPASEF